MLQIRFHAESGHIAFVRQVQCFQGTNARLLDHLVLIIGEDGSLEVHLSLVDSGDRRCLLSSDLVLS